MKKEQKRLFKIINTMNEDGKPTKIVKKTLSRLMGTKEATDWLIGLEEDPAIVSAATGTVRLIYGLMNQIEELEATVKSLESRIDVQREEIESLRKNVKTIISRGE